jgi:acetyl-CoA carboxylase biotin carboxyl carrier protein
MSDDRDEALAIEPLLAAVDLLVPALAASGLDEIEVETDELAIRLLRPRALAAPATLAPAPAQAAVAPGGATSVPRPATSAGFPEPTGGLRFVTAPLTGIWYDAPSPGARPYMQEGDEISVGQVVGLIEAMKLFNEIKSDVAGIVVRMLVETGTLAKRQQPLLEIDPR